MYSGRFRVGLARDHLAVVGPPVRDARDRGPDGEGRVVDSLRPDEPLQLFEVLRRVRGIDDEAAEESQAHTLCDPHRIHDLAQVLLLVVAQELPLEDALDPEEQAPQPEVHPPLHQVAVPQERVHPAVGVVLLIDPRRLDPFGQRLHPRSVHEGLVVGQVDVPLGDVLQLRHHVVHVAGVVPPVHDPPQRAEGAAIRTAHGGAHEGDGLHEVDEVVAAVLGHDRAEGMGKEVRVVGLGLASEPERSVDPRPDAGNGRVRFPGFETAEDRPDRLIGGFVGRLRNHRRRPAEARERLRERFGAKRAFAVWHVRLLIPIRVADVGEVDVERRGWR